MPESKSPLFIFSPRHGADLVRMSEGAGWRPVLAEDIESSPDTFRRSGAWVIVIDARDAMGPARKAVVALAEIAEKERSAILLILPAECDHLPWFRRNGVTHFIFAPFETRNFVEAVHFAARFAEQVSGGRRRGLRGRKSPAALFLTDSKRKRRRKRLEIDLKPALERDEIHILFQPQVSIATGKIVGVEALARWHHPELGEVGAEALFDAAEHSDLNLELSRHVHAKALREVAAWPALLSNLRVSLNITAGDIMAPGFVRNFLALIDASGAPRARVTVEVTESGLMHNLDTASSLLGQLREAGLCVAIDDFGTGYSSLAYLKILPLDYLKIDKRMSVDILGSTRDSVVVRSVIDMARSLDLAVVAEGVETQEQLDLLAAEGCTYSQGFLHSPPINSAALQDLVAARN